MAVWEVRAAGTASGPVGTALGLPVWDGAYDASIDTGGWTYRGGRTFEGRWARRDGGQPVSTTYSVTYSIQGAAGLAPPGTYRYLEAVAKSEEEANWHEATYDLVCPRARELEY